ncbi:MAG TPA: 2-amino-4-hydroxy-6-hydroxymethyldihydropteridine diphosphokinase [Anaerolineales bacterium]
MSEAGNETGEEHIVFLGLGSNIRPEQNLPQALDLLCEQVKVQSVSRAWKTPAVGPIYQTQDLPDFINAAMVVRTPLSAAELKAQVIRPIEARLGRVRTADKNFPRTIDIDILIFDGEVKEPQVWTQAFLAVPLAELIPDYTQPETGERLASIAIRLAHTTRFEPHPYVLPGYWESPELPGCWEYGDE